MDISNEYMFSLLLVANNCHSHPYAHYYKTFNFQCLDLHHSNRVGSHMIGLDVENSGFVLLRRIVCYTIFPIAQASVCWYSSFLVWLLLDLLVWLLFVVPESSEITEKRRFYSDPHFSWRISSCIVSLNLALFDMILVSKANLTISPGSFELENATF